MMPKTEYNINTENNLLIVNVGGTVVNGVIVGGTTKQVVLRSGQYIIGSNNAGSVNYVASNGALVFGLITELEYQLNQGFGAGTFNVFLATMPPPNGTGNNASVLNRVVITSSSSFIIDFTNSIYTPGSPFRVLGFNKAIYTAAQNSVQIYGNDDSGSCTSTELQNGTIHTVSIYALGAIYDYNMKDDPKYLIMQLDFGNKSAERIESSDIATNQKFAIILYDANDPDNIYTFNSAAGGSNVTLSTIRPPGTLKALKGSDFDKKILTFEPPLTLENFKISFYKYDNTYYDFNNREHLLTFELDVADYDPKYRY